MPPGLTKSQRTLVQTSLLLRAWTRTARGFLSGQTGISRRPGVPDQAVFLDDDNNPVPVLAAEIAMDGESEPFMLEGAREYLDDGVRVVWLLMPETRELVIVTRGGQQRLQRDDTVPERPELPGLSPRVIDLFELLPLP